MKRDKATLENDKIARDGDHRVRRTNVAVDVAAARKAHKSAKDAKDAEALMHRLSLFSQENIRICTSFVLKQKDVAAIGMRIVYSLTV